ncbi:hypothetical protein [Spirulina sp. 06S082]|uniref:hypothetical protein n=1 Tax=Spirulina sp. 06S082 TaxID=3110248 RepID=UPI002B214D40|nr:hypothetical protein [Spirulina sp. 06S082]MEA5468229.1 hypothetical protein [Spirulina sp. 06S082]
MTRFIHDQFAKQYLSELLSPLGTVEIGKEIHSEGRQIDLLFTPSASASDRRKSLGLLGRLTTTPALFEPFRNPATQSDIRTCMMKLFVILSELEREVKRTKISFDENALPQLWILTPTASANFLQGFSTTSLPNVEKQGIYSLGTSLRTAIIVIHQLPRTPDTLWLRLLGRGNVQKQAVRELEALPRENRLRGSVIELVKELISLLAKRQNKEQDLDPDDEELIMTLTQMYEEAMAEIRQQAKEEGRQEGRGEGEKEATRRLIENIFRVRFEEIDEELVTIIESIMQLSSEEFTPLLLQLSREELIQRFRKIEE